MATRYLSRSLLFSLLLLNTACAGVGWGQILDETLGGIYGDDISGEVRQVDVRRQEIRIDAGWGREEWIRYDRRTEVVYRNRRYRVRDLEYGDRVHIQLASDRSHRPYARYIRVQQSRRYDHDDRYRTGRLDGRIQDIDHRRGSIRLSLDRRNTVRVYLPYDPDRNLRQRFQRLREGDWVVVDVVYRSDGRPELIRIR